MDFPRHTPATAADAVAAGQEALARGAWEQARASFEQAVGEAESAEALEGLAWAAWWLDDAGTMFDARERAYRRYRSRGDARGAGRVATWLGTDHVDWRGEVAVGQGWHRRARRLLETVAPGPEHGWLYVHEAEKHLMANETGRARELAMLAAELGRSLGDVDLEMMGLATDGLVRVTECEVPEGMARLDEAAAAAFGGDFTETWSTVWCGCYLLYACQRVRDYERSAQWCRRIDEWSRQARVPFLNRICRAHYAELLIWHGGWKEAEELLMEAADVLAAVRPPMVAEALVRLADLRRRQGRLHEAAVMLERASTHPLALLGLAELDLERGDAAAARDRAEQYLRETPARTVTLRLPGLDVLARAHVALRQEQEAAATLEELAAIADDASTSPLRACFQMAVGMLARATGDLDRARRCLEDATRLFHRSGAPFEAGRARIELADVLADLGRARDAAREAGAAATSLRRIGAVHEARRAEALASEVRGPRSRAVTDLSPREREVLSLIAEGKSDRAIAEDLVLSEHTVHRHVANILAKLRCTSRSAAVAEGLRTGLI